MQEDGVGFPEKDLVVVPLGGMAVLCAKEGGNPLPMLHGPEARSPASWALGLGRYQP